MFIAALFIIAKSWKQSKCPSVSESLNKVWYIQTMEYYSTVKIHNIETCNNLDGSQIFIHSERS